MTQCRLPVGGGWGWTFSGRSSRPNNAEGRDAAGMEAHGNLSRSAVHTGLTQPPRPCKEGQGLGHPQGCCACSGSGGFGGSELPATGMWLFGWTQEQLGESETPLRLDTQLREVLVCNPVPTAPRGGTHGAGTGGCHGGPPSTDGVWLAGPGHQVRRVSLTCDTDVCPCVPRVPALPEVPSVPRGRSVSQVRFSPARLC